MNSNHELYYRSNRESCRLQFCNNLIKEDLIKYGLTPAKSLTLKFPLNIPDNLIRHFIRGYFDGDGHIASTGKKSCNIEVIGTKEVSDSIMGIFQSVSNAGDKLKLIKIGFNTYRVKLGTSEYAFKILEYMYDNSNIYLDRKYKIYNEIKQRRI